MTIQDKQAIRRLIREKKKQVSFEEKKIRSQKIWQKLEHEEVFKAAKTLMFYWSMKDEVHTHDFIKKWHPEKQIILPAVNGDYLDLKIYQGPESMKKGASFGILEPAGKNFHDVQSIDLIIVPGVAFDRQNNRLGRGKAYYDKLLKSYSGPKYGVCFDFQLVNHVPTDKYDIKMDSVITDSEKD